MSWDEKLNVEFESSWKDFVTRISYLQDVQIPRWLNTSSKNNIKILGFADASEKAYAAVVYVKTDKGVSLLAAKSKVNPIKNKKTLPKLELSAAFLLVRLLKKSLSLSPAEVITCSTTSTKVTPTLLNDLMKGNRSFSRYLTREELMKAEKYAVKGHQTMEWPMELRKLVNNLQLDHRHKLATLHPYVDDDGVMRVGGRLQYSILKFDRKHPMIIQKSTLSTLIIQEAHNRTMHGGNRMVESTVRRKFWIMNLRNGVKKVIRSCPVCIRYKQQNTQQLMGILPDYRVKVSFPFYHYGIDYAGPVLMKFSNGRGQRSFKGYIAVFICMKNRTVHLEAASGLTTEAFMAAL
ncbi:uncharacterized protein LOC131996077 [Stomoxys calcitrans]|uniref:uncharacterized protein LOC131996077 n=1 Tax=Stomoxys calcitrans TaxID=35570 RepID=UPI0027E3946C|nr:uncharacterized protein LOC131996077 [Stomoxys calcitrans]